MSVPCVIAMPVEVAERMLREAGVTVIKARHTAPPRGGLRGPLRVVRQRTIQDGIELVVAASAPLPEAEAPHD